MIGEQVPRPYSEWRADAPSDPVRLDVRRHVVVAGCERVPGL